MKIRRSSVLFGILYAALIVVVWFLHPEGLAWWTVPICALVGGFLAGFIDAALTDLLAVRRRR
jgi:fatty acid desaturase